MMRSATFDIFLGIAMVGVFALVAGSIYLLRSKHDTTRGWLMLAAALVLLGNVLIWTV